MLTRDYLQQLSVCAGARRQRALLVISGEPDWLNQQLSALDDTARVFVAGHREASPLDIPDDAERISPKQAGSCLGQERQRLVVDAFAGFNPNAFGQVSGVLVAGGLMFLLVPPLDEWSGF